MTLLHVALQKPERADDWLLDEMLRAVSSINVKIMYRYVYI